MDAIKTLNLSRDFNGVVAVDALNISVRQGQAHAFIGPNGAGKTTAIRMLATVLQPSSGDALIMGRSIVDEPREVRRLIGFVPDWFAASGASSIHEYLDFFARACGLKGAARRDAVERVESETKLDAIREKTVTGLSRGMQQRLSVGRALINDPPVLLLDEPAANLDPKARLEFRELARSLATKGKTLLISSHILPELAEICDSVTIIDKGRLLASGSMASVIANARAGGAIKAKARTLGPRADLEKALREIPCVAKVENAGALVEFEIEGGDAAAADVLRSLVAERKLPVAEFKTDEGGLEGVFMAITGADFKPQQEEARK